jgi:hypothetical protein
LNGQGFLHFIIYDLPVLLETLKEQELLWFMLNSARPHHTNAIRQQLHYIFPDKRIGRGVGNNVQYSPDIIWPPRSLDLNPCDFFL